MMNDMVQRRGNARATIGATGWATPVQRRGNGGETLSPYPYGVAPAFEGGANAFDLVPMPGILIGGSYAGLYSPFALCGSGPGWLA